MPQLDQITSGTVFEDTAVTFLGRILGESGEPITQSEISTITYSIYNATDLNTALFTGSVDKTTSIYDTLQDDARWTVDATGFNFEHSFSSSFFTTAFVKYRIKYLFTLTNSNTFWVIYELRTRRA